MTDTLLIKIEDKIVDLLALEKPLALLNELGGQWGALTAKLPTLHKPADVVEWLSGAVGTADAEAIFASAGLSNLYQEIVAAKDWFTKIPKEYWRLVQPLGDFVETENPNVATRPGWINGDDPGLVHVELSTPQGAWRAAEDKLDFTFTAAAGATLEAEAGALWPFKGDGVAPGLLRISAAGKIEGSAAATLPFPHGSIGGSAEAKAEPAIHYFFRPADSRRLYAGAVAAAIPNLADPFSLASVSRAFALSDLEGLIVTFDGSADVKVDIALGEQANLPAELFKVDAKITVSVGVKRDAAYQFSLRAGARDAKGGRAILTTLSRNKNAAVNWGLGVDLTLDLSGAAKRLHELLEPIAKQWDDALTKIKPFLKPGTWLQNKAKDELNVLATSLAGGGALTAAIEHDFALVLGVPGGTGQAVVDALHDKLIEKIDAVTSAASTDVGAEANKVVDEITNLLPAFAAAAVKGKLTAGLEALLAKVKTNLDDEVEAILAEIGFDKVKAALAKVGIKTDAAVSQLDQAFAGVRALLDQYAGYFQTLLTLTSEGAKAKIALQLSYEEKVVDNADIEISGTFTEVNDASSHFYKALLFGRLDALQPAFLTPVRGFTLNSESSIRRFSEVSERLGYTLVLFGLDFSGYAQASGHATITLLANGDISVSASGKYEEAATALSETRILSFVSSNDLMIARVEHEDRPRARSLRLAGLGLTATRSDKVLKRGEVATYLQRLQLAGLLSGVRVTAAEERVAQWARTRGNDEKVAGEIALAVQLNGEQMQRLIAWGKQVNDPASAAAADRQLFGWGVEALQQAGVWEPKAFKNDVELLRYASADLQKESRAHTDDVDFLYAARFQLPPENGPRTPTTSVRNLANSRVRAARALSPMVGKAAEIYYAPPDLGDRKGGWGRKQYRDSEKALAETSSEWLQLNSFILWFDEEMSRRTVAFIMVLIGLAKDIRPHDVGADGNGSGMLSLTLKQIGGSLERL
jgi:hypothetical protein